MMMTPMKSFLFVAISVFLFQPCLADTYKWVDDNGGLHFTDDITQVPERYRSKIDKLETQHATTGAKPGAAPAASQTEGAYKDRLGRGEEYWRASVEEGRKKLAEAQARLESLRAAYNELTDKVNVSQNSVQRATYRKERDQLRSEMDLCKNQIEEAKVMLEKKIPEEAELYKAKPEWVKQ